MVSLPNDAEVKERRLVLNQLDILQSAHTISIQAYGEHIMNCNYHNSDGKWKTLFPIVFDCFAKHCSLSLWYETASNGRQMLINGRCLHAIQQNAIVSIRRGSESSNSWERRTARAGWSECFVERTYCFWWCTAPKSWLYLSMNSCLVLIKERKNVFSEFGVCRVCQRSHIRISAATMKQHTMPYNWKTPKWKTITLETNDFREWRFIRRLLLGFLLDC